MAPQGTKGFWKPGQGIDDSIVGKADNGSGLIDSDSAAVISTRDNAQVRKVSISPPEGMRCEFRGIPKWVRVEQVGVWNRKRRFERNGINEWRRRVSSLLAGRAVCLLSERCSS
jgi:hypothetical protein